MAERLQKFMSHAGVASRRKSEELITEGRVKVNGKVVRELGTQVEPNRDVVMVDGQTISADPRSVYLLLHKPAQVISSVHDPEGRRVVNEFIPEEFGRVYPVGRLDWDSEGAILMTNDGELTELLTHPRHEVPKVYQVKVRGLLSETDPRLDTLRRGVRLDDGYMTREADVAWDSSTGKHTWLVVSIREGKNRQIRRMFDAVGLFVIRLRRIAYGPVSLADLEEGEFRRLTESEIDELYEAAGSKRDTLKASRGRLPQPRRQQGKKHSKAAKKGRKPSAQS